MPASTDHPPIRFLTAAPGGPRPFDDRSIERPIPLSNPLGERQSELEVTYREYLEGIASFVRRNLDVLGMGGSTDGTSPVEQIVAVDVISEKHGSDYHPARVRVHFRSHRRNFVVNVALTDRGRARIRQEFGILKRLRSLAGSDAIPEAYVLGEETISQKPGAPLTMTMFLGSWLDGFYEFHLTRETDAGPPALVLWDMHDGYRLLSRAQEWELYRQAAFILASFYDVATFEEIFPWHHASGDFVAAYAPEGLAVKLITVRQYAPRVVFEDNSPSNAIEALLIFLANLTVRMRLDRFDGVGEPAWADDFCVEATIRGVVDSLEARQGQGLVDSSLVTAFLARLQGCSLGELAGLYGRVADSYDPAAPDSALVAQQLVDHIFATFTLIRERSFSPAGRRTR